MALVSLLSFHYIPPETPKEIEPLEPPKQIEKSIPEKIEYYAEKNGADLILALEIAYAESEFYPNAKNPVSSASGTYQFIDGSFKHYCINIYKLTDTMKDKNDPDIQINCATKIMADYGYKDWDASASVWIKLPYKRSLLPQ